jgi:hypothetical protein
MIFIKKLLVSQLSQENRDVLEPDVSTPFSQQLAAFPYPEPDQSSLTLPSYCLLIVESGWWRTVGEIQSQLEAKRASLQSAFRG